ncbi:MAG: HPr family phosphocarrier protein, partial [Planctomycetota bacterium]
MPERCAITVTISNPLGMHARPAMLFVDVAQGFQSKVTVRKGAEEADASSIMSMMMLAATKGTVLEIIAEGPDLVIHQPDSVLDAMDE